MKTNPSHYLTDGPTYDVHKHLACVKTLYESHPFKTDDAQEKHAIQLIKDASHKRPYQLLRAIVDFIKQVYEEDDLFIPYFADLALPAYLRRMEEALSSTTRLARADEIMKRFLRHYYDALPPGAFMDLDDVPRSEVSTLMLLDRPYDVMSRGILEFMTATYDKEKPLFLQLTRKLFKNGCIASGYDPDSYKGQSLTSLHEFRGSLEQTAVAYLHDTSFLPLLVETIPFEIPRNAFRAHGAIFAPTDHGKTQTLQSIIVSFLKGDDPPAMFIMDSMGAMLKKIEKLTLFNTILKDRLVILDPTDERPPALNFFKMQGGSSAQQTALFFYLFKAIEQGLTQRQATMVAYLVALMQSIPNATLDTLRQVCESKAQLYPVDPLEPIAQDFFTHQFYGKDPLINQTKQQIAARLYTVGRNPVFNQMFSAPGNKFNAYECIQRKKVVLINTDRLFLGDEASGVFGRFIIAQCLAAALARAPVPEEQRHLALLIVDEAKAYFDEQTEKILSDARQFGLGLLFATQQPHQLPEGVRKEMYTNTSIKLIGPIDYSDRVNLSREMGTTPEFIGEMRSYAHDRTEFACHVRNVTPRAIKLTIPMGVLENEPRMSEDSHRAIRTTNRARYGADPQRQPAQPATPPTALGKRTSPHVELKEVHATTSKQKPEQRQTSSPVTELDTDH